MNNAQVNQENPLQQRMAEEERIQEKVDCSYCCELRSLDEIQQSSARKDEMPTGTLGHEAWRK